MHAFDLDLFHTKRKGKKKMRRRRTQKEMTNLGQM